MPEITVQSSRLSSVLPKKKPVAHSNGLSRDTANASATTFPLSNTNVDLIKMTWEEKRANPTATRAYIAEKLAISVHSATNYLNHNWLAERQLGHLAYADQELQVPRSAVENEAWALCQSGDHKWLKVSLYQGHAFRVTEVIKEQPGYLGSTIRDVYRVKTCNFCGFSNEQKKFSSIVV